MTEKSIENGSKIILCPACGLESGGELCMHCGENLVPKRVTVATLLHAIPDVFFDIDHGLFYTMRSFLTRPGKEIRSYFAGNRKKHYKPLKFVLFIGGFATLIYSRFVFTNGSPQSKFESFGITWNSLILMIQFPIIAFFTWLLYKKQQYTFGEHLVANAYLIGEVLLFYIALFPLYYWLDGSSSIIIAQLLYPIFILLYYSFAFYDWFYNRKGSAGLLLSFVLVLLLMIFIAIFTYFIQAILYYSFIKLGWA